MFFYVKIENSIFSETEFYLGWNNEFKKASFFYGINDNVYARFYRCNADGEVNATNCNN